MALNTTSGQSYTNRLKKLQLKKWKTLLDVQMPYRWNLRRLNPGRTLDVGCGIGRCLRSLPPGSVGLDHNQHSVAIVNELGLIGYTPEDFDVSIYNRPGEFDSLLFGHVLEHMTPHEGLNLIRKYTPLLRMDGRVIVLCPQEKGYAQDPTHQTFLDFRALHKMFEAAGLTVQKSYSFPFPRVIGSIFAYNEFVVVARKGSKNVNADDGLRT